MKRLLLVGLVVIVARLTMLALTGFTFDDALITERYAWMLAHGFGLAFNPGVKSYGFTSPAWMLLLVPGALLHVSLHYWAAGLSILCDAASGMMLWSMAGPRVWNRMALGAVFLLSPIMWRPAISGMDSSLFALGLVSMVYWRTERWLPLIRPEGWAFALYLPDKRQAWWKRILPGAVLMAAAWAYFGSPFPLSAVVKSYAYGPSWETARNYLGAFALWPTPGQIVGAVPLLLLAVAAVVSSLIRRVWFGAAAAGAILVGLAISGAPFCAWYLVPVVTLLLVEARLYMPRTFGIAIVVTSIASAGPAIIESNVNGQHFTQIWGSTEKVLALMPPTWTVMGEPAGVLGASGLRVFDEVGIVTPEMADIRAHMGDGWYAEALRKYQPELLATRARYLMANEPVTGPRRPWLRQGEADSLMAQYTPIYEARDESGNPNWDVVILARNDVVNIALERMPR